MINGLVDQEVTLKGINIKKDGCKRQRGAFPTPANWFDLFGLLTAGKKETGFGAITLSAIDQNGRERKDAGSVWVSRVTAEQLEPARLSKFEDNVIFAPDIVIKTETKNPTPE